VTGHCAKHSLKTDHQSENSKRLSAEHQALQAFLNVLTKHYKNIEERDTLLFTILFNKKHKNHTASFCHFLCQNII